MLGTFSPILVSERYYYYYICVNIICNQLLYCSYMSLQIEGEEALKNRCVCDTRAEKFNIISNNHGRTRKCNFSVSDCKYRFWANLVQNIKKVSLSWNMVPRLIRICRVHWLCSLFPFLTKNIQNTLFGQIWPKIQNCQSLMTMVLSWDLVPTIICKKYWKTCAS